MGGFVWWTVPVGLAFGYVVTKQVRWALARRDAAGERK